MKKGIAIVLATSVIYGLSCYQALGQEQASGAQKTVLKYEGVLTTYDERAGTITIDTGSDKVVLRFTENTDIKARSKDSPHMFCESKGGVLLSIACAQIPIGDKVDVTCEAAKRESGIVCTRMTMESISAATF
jgi:phage baseplate assembly protein gpV